MIINFEHTVARKYLCKCLGVYKWLHQKWRSIHFLFLSKNGINSVLKIPVANVCRLNPQTHPRHGRCAASWNFNCVWFVDQTFPVSKHKVHLKLCKKLLTKPTLCVLKVVSLASPETRPKVLNTNVSEWMQ